METMSKVMLNHRPLLDYAVKRPRRWVWLLGLMLLFGSLGGQVASAQNDARRLAIRTLSSPPEWVSGGDVRIEVRVPADVALRSVVVEAEGADVTRPPRCGRRAAPA